MGKLLALDGTNLVHRAYHALSKSGMKNTSGTPVWALHGFVSMTANLVSAVRPSSLLIAFDSPGGCPSRRALAPSYKLGRKTPDIDLVTQLDALPGLLRSAGLCTVEVPQWEADDILASAAHMATTSGSSCVVVSSDKDLHQLISPMCMVRKPEGPVFSTESLVAKWGVSPDRWVEYAALCGEAADNLPGVPKVGPKRAVRILDEFSDVELAADSEIKLAELVGAPVAASLTSHMDVFRCNRKVGTLRRDLSFDINNVKLQGFDVDLLRKVFGDAELPAAAEKLAAALS